MPDLIAANDLLEVRFIMKAGAQFGMNVRHFRVSPGITGSPSLATAALAFDAYYKPKYQAVTSVAAAWFGTGVRKLLPVPSLEYNTGVGAGFGLIAGDLVPAQVAGLISLRTDLPGKKFRGRAYIMFPSETDNSAGGAPIVSYVTECNKIALGFSTEVTYANGADTFKAKGVIYHRAAKTETTITSAFTRPNWATQRRRSFINHPDRTPW